MVSSPEANINLYSDFLLILIQIFRLFNINIYNYINTFFFIQILLLL